MPATLANGCPLSLKFLRPKSTAIPNLVNPALFPDERPLPTGLDLQKELPALPLHAHDGYVVFGEYDICMK